MERHGKLRGICMLHYKIRYIEHRGHIDDFVFDFDKDFSLLGMFLSSDVTPFEDWIKADLDEVLSGECERKEFFGNVCGVEITPSTTKIYDNLIDSDEEFNKACCEVDTNKLRLLISEWCEKLKEFKKEKE